ncbi:hypothetical protein MPNT_160030 [Candidatus Methylacidithermus pantelleriae]|uniref:Uncharacterized protein n=1 Tax=Candidatus Methylacidithermus pantelleriae TaxID=2744239 RepID=A0A8J2FRV3_9BACT|nr:hypothetical protein MPNT_160030 [Candidatus Methylacidithermus pantelleriae]
MGFWLREMITTRGPGPRQWVLGPKAQGLSFSVLKQAPTRQWQKKYASWRRGDLSYQHGVVSQWDWQRRRGADYQRLCATVTRCVRDRGENNFLPIEDGCCGRSPYGNSRRDGGKCV